MHEDHFTDLSEETTKDAEFDVCSLRAGGALWALRRPMAIAGAVNGSVGNCSLRRDIEKCQLLDIFAQMVFEIEPLVKVMFAVLFFIEFTEYDVQAEVVKNNVFKVVEVASSCRG